MPLFNVEADAVTLKREMGAFVIALDRTLKGVTGAAVYRLATAVRDAMRREFIAGTDKDGESHDKTGATLNTWRIEYGPMRATIVMRGGSYYVEYRQPPHWIEAKSGGALHWNDGGTDYFAKRVFHPGYKGDKFVERGIERGLAGQAVLNDVLRAAGFGGGAVGDWHGPTMREAGIDPYQR